MKSPSLWGIYLLLLDLMKKRLTHSGINCGERLASIWHCQTSERSLDNSFSDSRETRNSVSTSNQGAWVGCSLVLLVMGWFVYRFFSMWTYLQRQTSDSPSKQSHIKKKHQVIAQPHPNWIHLMQYLIISMGCFQDIVQLQIWWKMIKASYWRRFTCWNRPSSISLPSSLKVYQRLAQHTFSRVLRTCIFNIIYHIWISRNFVIHMNILNHKNTCWLTSTLTSTPKNKSSKTN